MRYSIPRDKNDRAARDQENSQNLKLTHTHIYTHTMHTILRDENHDEES